MTAKLPRKDKATRRRREALAAARALYTWDRTTLPPLAFVADVPPHECFSMTYHVEWLGSLTQVAMNLAGARTYQFFDTFDAMNDFEDVYPVLPEPAIIGDWKADWRFARQRVDGANPMVIERVRTVEELEVFQRRDEWRRFLGVQTVLKSLEKGHLYVCRYPILEKLPVGTVDGKTKYLPVPEALFAWVGSGFKDRGELVPVAIRHRVDGEYRTFTPNDGPRWLRAKTMVQVADANHHEMSAHLGRTHLVMEPFAVVTPRQLAPNHPVRLLLEPHLRFLLARNEDARQRMIRPGTYVDVLLGSSLAGSLEIVRRSVMGYQPERGPAVPRWSFHGSAHPMELERRGVHDPDALPDYPFRDDGMLHWQAIGTYVNTYARMFYRSDDDVRADRERQFLVLFLCGHLARSVTLYGTQCCARLCLLDNNIF